MITSSTFNRRKFLKYTLLGVGGLAGVGAATAAWFTSNKNQTHYKNLQVLSGHYAEVIEALTTVILPQKPPYPTIAEAQVIQRLDEELFFVDATIQSDFKALIYLLEGMPLAKGYFSRFSRLAINQRKKFLEEMLDTDNDLFRAAIANLRMVVRMIYFGHAATWKIMGYEGPHGNLPEVVSEQRKYYATLTASDTDA